MKLVDRLFWLAVLIVSISFFYLRFSNYSFRFNFAMDQGVHLIEAKNIVDTKHIPLIGPSTSKTFQGRQFFTGPIYYYILAILGQISNWNPLIINASFIIVDYFFLLIFTVWLKKRFNAASALSVFVFFVFSKYFIFHHTFFWNPHPILSLSFAAIYFLDRFKNSSSKKNLYAFSFVFGLAFSFHYTVILWLILALIIVFPKIKTINIKDYLVCIFLFLLADLPFYTFELRHNFYNLKTAFMAAFSQQSSGLTSHYFVFPLIAFLVYIFLLLIQKSARQVFYLCFSLLIFVFVNIFQKYDLPKFSYSNQQKAIDQIINFGCPVNFNITQTLTGDSRAYNLRFLLLRKKCQPNSVNDYPNSQIIYLISSSKDSFSNQTIWELTSGNSLNVDQKISLNSDVDFYKLVRQ